MTGSPERANRDIVPGIRTPTDSPEPMPTPKYPLAHHSLAKDELLVIAITRESVDACDVRPLMEKLERFAAMREAAIAWEGKLKFYFEGWDSDPRETAEIPEIRRYFRDLSTEFPYWFHYIEKVRDTFGHVLRLLCRGPIVRREGGFVGWVFDDMGDLQHEIGLLFGGMNALYGRLALPEEMNERVSQEVAKLIECSLQRLDGRDPPPRQGGLAKSESSHRVSDHYPLWTAFGLPQA